MASSGVALAGVLANLFLFGLFSTTRSKRGGGGSATTPPTLYPRVLALLDATICVVYILLFGADAAVVYLHIKVSSNEKARMDVFYVRFSRI